MEVKKKFEKPQMEVVQLKPAGIICDSVCYSEECPTECATHCDQCLFN